MNNLFYLHPRKCGGHSILKCLQGMGIKFLFTPQIRLDKQTIQLLRSEERVIIFGHTDWIENAETNEQINIKSDILKLLFWKSDLIMPTRNPSNLLQSWMHYSKTRSNKILEKMSTSNPKFQGKDAGMLLSMSPLRQNCLVFSEDGASTRKGKDFPCFQLKEEDEELNLLAFVDFMRERNIAQLCSMQAELFRIYWTKLMGLINQGQSPKLDLPVTNKERKVIYYDCENIDSRCQQLLDKAVRHGFSERLINTRENASENPSKKKGCEFEEVNAKLQEIAPGEWQIYAKSKESS